MQADSKDPLKKLLPSLSLMFRITVANDLETKDLFFNLYSTDIADRWFKEVKKDYEIYEDDRFTNWPNSYKTEQWFIDNLNQQIDIINSYEPLINQKMSLNADQETMNILHKHFENLRGHIEAGTDWFYNAPEIVKSSVEKFNVLIHEYESYKKNHKIQIKHPYSGIVCTFKNAIRKPLLDEDYKYFTYRWKFGEVYINYCEVGKPPFDVFVDEDYHVGDTAVRPQTHYSADFMIRFGPETNLMYYMCRKLIFNFWCFKNKMFARFGKNKIAAGMIPVARINLKISGYENYRPLDIVYDLSKYTRIIKISCIK